MKQSSFKLLLAAACLLFSFGLRAQTYTAGHLTVNVTDSFSHDSTICGNWCFIDYHIVVDSSFPGDSLLIIDTLYGTLMHSFTNPGGTVPWVIDFNIYGIGYTDYGTPTTGGVIVTHPGPTTKVIHATDTIHYINNIHHYLVSNPCGYGVVTGQVYADNNDNCVFDTGDDMLYVPDMTVTGHQNLTAASSMMGNTLYGYDSTVTGHYYMYVQNSWMTNYSVYLPPYYSFIFPPSSCSPAIYNFTTVPQPNVDFPVHGTANVDVQCGAGGPPNVRPNRPFLFYPSVFNLGYSTVAGQLTLIKDSRVVYDASLSTYPADIVNGDTLIWNYYNLSCIANGAYWNNFMTGIYLTPISTVNIGDTLCFHIFTGVPPSDINPANNDYTICLPVVNSYDPNEKEVSPKGDGPLGEIGSTTPELTYTIHFQNTGTDVAYDINVIDTLSANVDASSLKILGTSHTMFPEWVAPGVVKFKFNNIYLADSFSNEPASHGYVRFKVKMRSGLTPGTQIKNKGYIYFDFNPPVITNEALNTIIHTVSVNHVAVSNVKVYPNPASDAMYVENLQDGNISILSMNGSVVLNQNITNSKTEINIDRLPAGVYILKTVSKDGVTTRKFVKE